MQKNRLEDWYNEIPIEEFENNNQDFRNEFLEKFGKQEVKEKEQSINKSESYKKWL